jgi:hypothetical protein
MDSDPVAEFVVFEISFPTPTCRFVVPPAVANLFSQDSVVHFEIESDNGELIFEGTAAMKPDGFDLGRTVDPGTRLSVQMEVVAPETVKKPIALGASASRFA